MVVVIFPLLSKVDELRHILPYLLNAPRSCFDLRFFTFPKPGIYLKKRWYMNMINKFQTHVFKIGLTRALLGLWIFHRLLGGGAFERPPPMISAPGRCREKRKAAFESSRKIISKSFQSFFVSGQNCGLQGSKFQNFPKRFFDNKIFNFKDRATNLIPLCFSR